MRSSMVSASLFKFVSIGFDIASSQWIDPMKYFIVDVGIASSILKVTMGMPAFTALPTSRITCGDAFEFFEKTSTKTRLPLIPFNVAFAYVVPGRMSLGAIQQ